MVNPAYIILTTVDKIVEDFPFPTIFPIIGKPNYKTVAEVHFKLNSNSASVQSNLGYGQLGLLYLTVSPSVYNTLFAIVFIPPVNPGATTIITAGSTSAAIANELRSFADATALFKQYDSADKSLKKMLLIKVEEMFVRSLQTMYGGYLNVSTRNILNNLYSEYARISAADLQNKDVALKTAYDPNQRIESLFDQVENALNYAAAGNTPYSPAQVVATAFQILFATSMFLENCKTRKRKPDADKNWANFKTYFSLTHCEFREIAPPQPVADSPPPTQPRSSCHISPTPTTNKRRSTPSPILHPPLPTIASPSPPSPPPLLISPPSLLPPTPN